MVDVIESSLNKSKPQPAHQALSEEDARQFEENAASSFPSKPKPEDFHDESSAAWINPSPVLYSPKTIQLLHKKSKRSTDISTSNNFKDLLRSVPQVKEHFHVIRQIGCGTFSNVYLATLKKLGHESPKYALKHIFSTSHPKRIENEIKCLRDIGGDQYVVGIEGCIRHKGEVVIIMPYIKHNNFAELLKKMKIDDVREYMFQLLLSLHRVHQFNVIHRDVKPNNFLFDMETRRSGLVDFGLAQPLSQSKNDVEPTKDQRQKPSQKQSSHPSKRLISRSSDVENKLPMKTDAKKQESCVQPRAKRRCLAEIHPNKIALNRSCVSMMMKRQETSTSNLMRFPNKKFKRCLESCKSENIVKNKALTSNNRDKLSFVSFKSPISLTNRSPALGNKRSSTTVADVFPSIRKYSTTKQKDPKLRGSTVNQSKKSCNCFGNLTVCRECLARPAPNASRAGTAGFRSPEVLMRYSAQSTAVDVWAAGVIFLSLLSGRCPFFRPADDVDSLSQLLLIFGSKRIQEIARLLGKKMTCSEHFPGQDLRGIVMSLRQPPEEDGPTLRRSPRQRNGSSGSPTKELSPLPESAKSFDFDVVNIPDSAFDLLSRLLDPNPRTRITSTKALYHEFFAIRI
ncbi:unnamed protein product [Clavelina lepadiformis]|uniref:non-specific serine/threonine protein kinase n=1 Tax=Clavelina lepadiformis TaxID=159417 RepID=A0ABP0F3V6_CLALP